MAVFTQHINISKGFLAMNISDDMLTIEWFFTSFKNEKWDERKFFPLILTEKQDFCTESMCYIQGYSWGCEIGA